MTFLKCSEAKFRSRNFKPTLPILSSNLSLKFNVRNEMKFILKRDGTKQEYLPYKIQDAIKKAFESESKEYDDKVFLDVMGHVFDSEVLSVEDIQDYIEKALFNAGPPHAQASARANFRTKRRYHLYQLHPNHQRVHQRHRLAHPGKLKHQLLKRRPHQQHRRQGHRQLLAG